MNAQAKTINLLLYDGSLNGVISIEDSNWNAGELYSAPRESVSDLLKTDACNKYGVYLLLSQSMVYVGQASDLAKRLNQHIIGKDWWESAVILTTKDDSLNHSDIDYLENVLIEKAFALKKLDCDNKKKGNPPKVDKFRKVYLGQYLDEALFLMQLIGINVFSETKVSNKPQTTAKPIINTLDVKTQLTIGKRAKSEAIDFLKEQGVQLAKKTCYAVRQAGKGYCWANPQATLLDNDWSFILNNTDSCEMIVMLIPANSLALKTNNTNGLKVRHDNAKRIDLKIDLDTLKDLISGTDFSVFVQARYNY